jgi:hypothetical protein
MQVARPERGAGQAPALRVISGGGVATILHAVVVQAVGRGDAERLATRLDQRDGRRREHSAQHRGLAHQFEQLRPRLDPHDGFVGGPQRLQHPGQAILLPLGPGFFVNAIEILQCKGHVVGEPLQEFGEFGDENVLFGGQKQHDADGLATHQQGKRRAGLRAVAADHRMEGNTARIGQIVVADAGLAGAKRRPAKTASFRVRRVDRERYLPCIRSCWTGHGHQIEVIIAGPGKRDASRDEFAALSPPSRTPVRTARCGTSPA